MPQIDIESRGPHGDNLYEWLSINGNVATRKARFNPDPERFLEHLAYCTADLLDCYDWAMGRIPLPSGQLSIACHRDPLSRHQVPSLGQSSRLNREFSRGESPKYNKRKEKNCHEKMKGNNEIVASAGEDWISFVFLI